MSKVGADRAQVVLEDVGELLDLVLGEVFRPFEETPSRAFEERLEAPRLQVARLLGADVVDRLVEILDDMEAVEDV